MTAADQRIASLDMKVTATGPAPIPDQAAMAIAAAYLEAGKGSADVAALARLFGALPHMETSILAAMDELSRLEAAAPCRDGCQRRRS
jgi:hypothetical protein